MSPAQRLLLLAALFLAACDQSAPDAPRPEEPPPSSLASAEPAAPIDSSSLAPGFSSSARVTPWSVAPGGEVWIEATVSHLGAPLSSLVVTLEVFDEAGQRVGQRHYPDQTFTPGRQQSYGYRFAAGGSPGPRFVAVGVFGSGLSPLLHWNAPAAGFTVLLAPDAGSPKPDAGAPALDAGSPPLDGGTPSRDGGSPTRPAGWLYTAGNHLYQSDGSLWRGRGANIHDTRSCNACAYSAPNVSEVKRRIDELVGLWKASFLRLDLESYASSGGRTHWQGVLQDPAYLADLKEIVGHIGKKTGVYVLVSLWIDPTFDALGRPTQATLPVLKKLAETFKNDSHVLFGVSNEPQHNYNGADDAFVWKAMNDSVQAIREVENGAGTPQHIVAVQGTGGWARFLGHYLRHPITAGGGGNVAYETHVYDPASDFPSLFGEPAKTLPVIIGEFGPTQGMTVSDCLTLISQARQLVIPHLAWTFHMRCGPDLLQDNSGGGCGVNMPLLPSSWGNTYKAELAKPW